MVATSSVSSKSFYLIFSSRKHKKKTLVHLLIIPSNFDCRNVWNGKTQSCALFFFCCFPRIKQERTYNNET
jgi:hypothetical protein